MRREFGRKDGFGFGEILIARAARLAVPELLVFDLGGGELGHAFKADRYMAQVGDRGVAVLEIKAFEKFRRVMGADPIERVTYRIGRPAVARQGIGELFRRHWRNGQYALRSGMRERHGCGHRIRYDSGFACESESRSSIPTRVFRSTRTVRPKMPASISGVSRTPPLFPEW